MPGSSSTTSTWCMASVMVGLRGRQRELESRAAAGPCAALDLAAVSTHDRAADREPEPDADGRRLVLAALKLVEQPFGVPRR